MNHTATDRERYIEKYHNDGGEIGADSRALKHALSETPMQSDQIVQLAQAIRLLAFHVDTKIIYPGGSCCREELRGIRDNMEDLIFTIKGRQ